MWAAKHKHLCQDLVTRSRYKQPEAIKKQRKQSGYCWHLSGRDVQCFGNNTEGMTLSAEYCFVLQAVNAMWCADTFPRGFPFNTSLGVSCSSAGRAWPPFYHLCWFWLTTFPRCANLVWTGLGTSRGYNCIQQTSSALRVIFILVKNDNNHCRNQNQLKLSRSPVVIVLEPQPMGEPKEFMKSIYLQKSLRSQKVAHVHLINHSVVKYWWWRSDFLFFSCCQTLAPRDQCTRGFYAQKQRLSMFPDLRHRSPCQAS